MILFCHLTKVLLHYLAKHRNTNIAPYLLKCCITAFLEFNQSLLNSCLICWLETHIYDDIDSLNLVINWVQLRPVGAMAQEK